MHPCSRIRGGGNDAPLHGLRDGSSAGGMARSPRVSCIVPRLQLPLFNQSTRTWPGRRAAPRRLGDSMLSSAALASNFRPAACPVPLQLSDRATMQCTAAAARAQVAGSAASQHRTGSSLRQAVPQRHQQQRSARQMSVQATAAPEKPQLQRPDSTGA